MTRVSFADRYGPWALVAGASEGLGAAFARSLADRGLRLVLAARRSQPLAALGATLPTEVVTVAADLATNEGLADVLAAAADRDVGLVVANAAYSPIGPFLGRDLADLQRVLDVNTRAPVTLAHALLPAMVARGRGGFVIMSSLSSLQGSPGISTYAASKAFDAVLAEGLWAELRGTGVDVVTCLAGAIATPGLAAAAARNPPGTLAPEVVAEAALRGLGRGPRVVAGGLMKLSAALVSRLPRRTAISMIARASRGLS